MKSLFSTFFCSTGLGVQSELVTGRLCESFNGNPVQTFLIKREYLSGSRASMGNEYLDPADRKNG